MPTYRCWTRERYFKAHPGTGHAIVADDFAQAAMDFVVRFRGTFDRFAETADIVVANDEGEVRGLTCGLGALPNVTCWEDAWMFGYRETRPLVDGGCGESS